jgi:hypothetical protein
VSNFAAPPLEDGFLSLATHTVGVWVSQSDASHVALSYLFQKDSGDYRVYDFHLSGNERLLNDEIDWRTCRKQRFAHCIELDDISKISLPGFINKVVANEKISFGIDWLGNIGTLDPATGIYTPPADKPGFTCATFLDEVFRAFGFELVDMPTWPRDDAQTIKWRDDLADRLEKNGKTPAEVIARIRETDPVMRLFPSEFAAAAAAGLDDWPLNKESAFEAACEIIEDFNKARGNNS